MADLVADVRAAIRDVPDFPKPGILFYDITPVLADPELFQRVCRWFADAYRDQGIQRIVALDARGFLFGGPLVGELGASLVPVRKKGKLPYQTVSVEYDLEYGSAAIEIHVDAIQPGDKVLVVDDLLATGGTAAATVDLVRRLGGEVVGCVFLVELDFLGGRAKVDAPAKSLIHY